MNRIKKRLIVRFFSIKASERFFSDFISIQKANQANEENVRIINIRDKKYLIKIHTSSEHEEGDIYFLTVVRERNTWQARALRDGTVSGIPLNQGIIGDPYFLLVVPKLKVILGFTTGPSVSLKGTASAVLQQFNKDKTSVVTLKPVSKEREFSKLTEFSGFHKLHFKITVASLEETNESAPGILRQLSAAPFLANNSEIALTFTEIGDDGFTENDLLDIVSYLSENDGCSALTVKGFDNEGVNIHLDFNEAYAIYKTEVELRDTFIDEFKAKKVLLDALNSFDTSMLTLS